LSRVRSKRGALLAGAAAVLLLAGCAGGDDRAEIMVQTDPPGAACTLVREGKPIGAVDPTPGMALVARSEADIAVTCTRNGFERTTHIAHIHDSEPSFSDVMAGRDGTRYNLWVTVTMTPRAATADVPAAGPRKR
jgi:hypothetical protein